MSVFPPRSLPGESDKWGREVETRIRGLETDLRNTGQTSDNNSRFVGGQLAVQAAQLGEQFDRTTLVSQVGDLSVTGNATIEPFPRASRSITFNPPGGARVAQVEIYVNQSNQNFGSVSLFANLSYGGEIISRITWSPDTDDPDPLSAPSSPVKGSGMAYVVLPESGPATFTLTLVRVGFTSDTTTETLTGITAYLTPFQKTV